MLLGYRLITQRNTPVPFVIVVITWLSQNACALDLNRTVGSLGYEVISTRRSKDRVTPVPQINHSPEVK